MLSNFGFSWLAILTFSGEAVGVYPLKRLSFKNMAARYIPSILRKWTVMMVMTMIKLTITTIKKDDKYNNCNTK